MEDKGKLYGDLYASFKQAYPSKKPLTVQYETNIFWHSVKDKDNVTEIIKQKVLELSVIKRKTQGGLISFWAKVRT